MAFLILLWAAVAATAGRIIAVATASVADYRPPYRVTDGDASEGPHVTHKLVLVVIDGLSLDRSRRMRSLDRLRSQGADFDCVAGVPACSSSAKATLATGAWPEVHGILADEPPANLSIDNLFRAAGCVGSSRALAGAGGWRGLFGADLADATLLAEPIVTKERRGSFRAAETAILAFGRQAVQFVAARQARLSVLELSVVELAARESGARSSDYARASLEADRLVGQLADGLNLWTTTLVVTSDHGQADQPGVPLVMAGRGIRSGVVGAARQIDVAPTIAGLLGLPVPAASQGRALVEAFDTNPEKTLALLQRQWRQKDAFERAYAVSLGESPANAESVQAPSDVESIVRSLRSLDARMESVREARIQSERRSRSGVAAAVLIGMALLVLGAYAGRLRTALSVAAIASALYAGSLFMLGGRLPPDVARCAGGPAAGPVLAQPGIATFTCVLVLCIVVVAYSRRTRSGLPFVDRCLLALAPACGAAYLLMLRIAYVYWQQGLSMTWLIGEPSLRAQSLADLARVRGAACAALVAIALTWMVGRFGRPRVPAIAVLALLVGTGPLEAAGGIHSSVPDHPDASKHYLFYLHGRIIELQGRKAVSPDFGPYDYDGILRALAEAGFEVISEVRPADTGLEYGKKIAAQARGLLAAKVPPEHITIAGFSKGGSLALATATDLGEPRVNFVIMAGCGDDLPAGQKGPLEGRILSIYDASDAPGVSCARLLPQTPGAASREIVLHVGRGHGTFYTPLKEWLGPLRDWALAK